MIEFAHNSSLLSPPPKLISLLCILSDYIFKIIKPPYSLPKVGIKHLFAIYHQHYKKKFRITKSAYNPYMLYSNKLISNPTRISVYTASCRCFGYNLSRLGYLSMVSLFAHDTKTCAIIPDLVTKKRKSLKISLHLIFHCLQPLFFLLSSTFFKMRLVIFEYMAMLKYTTMCK